MDGLAAPRWVSIPVPTNAVSKRGSEELTNALDVVAVNPMAIPRRHTAAEPREPPSSMTAVGVASRVTGADGVGDRGKSNPRRRHPW